MSLTGFIIIPHASYVFALYWYTWNTKATKKQNIVNCANSAFELIWWFWWFWWIWWIWWLWWTRISETFLRWTWDVPVTYFRSTWDIPEMYLRCSLTSEVWVWGAVGLQLPLIGSRGCWRLEFGNYGFTRCPPVPLFPTLPYRYTTCVLTTLGISRPLTFAGVPHYPAPPVLSTRLYIPSILHPRPDPHQSVLAHIPHHIPYLPKSHSGKLYLNMYEYSSLG